MTQQPACQNGTEENGVPGQDYVIEYQFGPKTAPVEIKKALDILKEILSNLGLKDPRATRRRMEKDMRQFGQFLADEAVKCKGCGPTALFCAKHQKLAELKKQTENIIQRYKLIAA